MNNDKGIKDGKKPVTEKIDLKEYLSTQEVGRGLLRFPAHVERFAQKHGIRLSWRSYAEVNTAGGYDPAGWVIFRREMLEKDPEFATSGKIDSVEFEFGGHSSPVFRRGDLILGYMMADQWRQERQRETDSAIRKARVTKSAAALQQKIGSKAVKVTEVED